MHEIDPGHRAVASIQRTARSSVQDRHSQVPATPGDVTEWMYSGSKWLRHTALGALTTADL
jgi:hypothetical protein